jgi:hypothetical protein
MRVSDGNITLFLAVARIAEIFFAVSILWICKYANYLDTKIYQGFFLSALQ